jgi:hypothetical protein
MIILIVGGSNSVMAPGYTTQLEDLLARSDIADLVGTQAKVTNLSVGANSSIRGLETLKQTDLGNFDMFILEYFINDFSLANRDGIEFWLSCYEGMIRHILSVRPQARILPLLLGRRDKTFFPRQRSMRKHMASLADTYGLRLVDFDSFAHESLTYRNQFRNLYDDGNHLKRPQITALIASHLVLAILAELASPPVHRLPDEITPLAIAPFDDAQTLDANAVAPVDLPRIRFVNSRYDVSAVAMSAGTQLKLPSGVSPISISFVAAPDAGQLRIGSDSLPNIQINTLHKRVKDGDFAFLLKTLAIAPLWNAVEGRGKPITLWTVQASDQDVASLTVNEFNMIQNTSTTPQTVYLVSLLVRRHGP